MDDIIKRFKEKASNIHDNKYDYSKWTNYTGKNKYHNKNIPVICPTHGLFLTSLANHLRGSGCPECGRITSTKKRRKTIDYYINKAKKIHGDLYDYTKWTKVDNTSIDKVEIICKKHGSFFQTPASHIDKKAGCPRCATYKRHEKCLQLFNVKHHSQIQVLPLSLRCLESKDWLYNQHIIEKKSLLEISKDLKVQDTTVGRYMRKYGLPTIRYARSYNEKLLADWLFEQCSNINLNDRTLIPPFEVDIYIPDARIAIEYCGLYWHSEQNGKNKHYHKQKFNLCLDQHVQLLTIFEDEWVNKQNIVKSKILHLLNKQTNKKVFARNTVAVILTPKEKKIFLNHYHIQGNGPSSINIGLKDKEGVLVAVMGFVQKQNGVYELSRYCTSCSVIGGFSKLLSHFKNNYNWSKIVSFADLRWSLGELYEKTGWKREKIIEPDYYYSTNGHNRFHKFNFRRSLLPKKLKYFDPNLSERENCDNNGLLRVWDCGKIKYSIFKD